MSVHANILRSSGHSENAPDAEAARHQTGNRDCPPSPGSTEEAGLDDDQPWHRHLPWPGLGHFSKRGDGFHFEPEPIQVVP
jgi:hypothetical protein